jgi:hypothetical protein
MSAPVSCEKKSWGHLLRKCPRLTIMPVQYHGLPLRGKKLYVCSCLFLQSPDSRLQSENLLHQRNLLNFTHLAWHIRLNEVDARAEIRRIERELMRSR